MLSWNKPPRYHAGSFGARLIIAPPVATGIESAKMPCGPPTSFMMFSSGSVQNAFDQSTGGRCCARSNDMDSRTRSACVAFFGIIGRT